MSATVDFQRVDDDAYQVTLDDAVITIDRVHDSHREGLSGEVKIHWNGQPAPRLLLPSTRTTFARAGWQRTILPALKDAQKSLDWQQILTNTFQAVIDNHRTGPTLRPVSGVVKPAPKFLVRPIISASGATVIAAMGGTGKGWYAIAAALTVATGSSAFLGLRPDEQLPVVYLDWEDDKDYFDERVHSMCAPHKVKIPTSDQMRHAECDRPFGSMIDGLIRDLHRDGITRAFFVIDSRGAAVGSDVNEAIGTNDLYDAVRRLPGPSLVVDHQSWEAARKKRDGAIGSVYGWNRPRMIWNAESAPTIDGLALVIRNPKFNRGRRQDNLAWSIEIRNGPNDELEAAVLRPIPATSVTALGADGETTMADQIEAILSTSEVPWTVKDLAEQLGKPEGSVRTVLGRNSDRFVNVSDDRTTRWTMADRDNRQTLPEPI